MQADAILRMTLGQLVNLEQEKLAGEYEKLLDEISEYVRILSDDANIRAIIREDLETVKRKHADKRRTEISGEEIGNIDLEDLITEETMVVTISHNGYIKRTAASVYRAQRRGGKGLKGAKAEDEDPIEHLFVASTHDYLMFFTNRGKVFWQKVYGLPQLSRESRGRALVNLLQLAEGEKITDCRAVRDFDEEDAFLVMATRKGLVKKTELRAYRRPISRGIIAIKLRDDDELVDVVVTRPGDHLVLATSSGMAIRFDQADARAMGRNSSGVKGVSLGSADQLIGMVVAREDSTLLTVCANGYGKRTPFSAEPAQGGDESHAGNGEGGANGDAQSSAQRYPVQRRGGKGVRDIKTTERNGPVVGIASVTDDDELLMITARGKLQRIASREISVIGRNTQGVRIMNVDDDDELAAIVRVPRDANGEPAAETPSGPEAGTGDGHSEQNDAATDGES